MSCVSSPFSLPPKALSIDVDKRPRDLSPTVHFNPFFSSMLPSTFVTFWDTNTSSPFLGFFQPPSQCHSPGLLSMNFCHLSRRSGTRYVPAVGCFLTRCGSALFMPAVGYALFTSCRSALLTRCGSALLASFHQDHPSVHVHSGIWLELCSLPRRRCFASASVSPRERRTHRLLQCGALVCQGLALFSCGRHGTP